MADIIPALFAFPPDKPSISPAEYDKLCQDYIEKTLKKIAPSQWTKQIDKDKQTLLDLLNPAVNTLPYMAALVEHMRLATKDQKKLETVFDQTQVFLASFDPVQARYSGEYWRNIWEWAADVTRQNAVTDVSFLAAALLRLDPTAGTFTSMHFEYLHLCLAVGVPSQALPIISKNIYAFPQPTPKTACDDLLSGVHELSNSFITASSGFSAKLTPQMVLEYYLLGAHVFIGLRNYSRARLFLESVILHPSMYHATSALQIEAYKKFVLLGLLAEGRQYPTPKTADGATMKTIRALSKAYESLADDFEKRDWKKFAAEADVGSQEWQADGNLSMVRDASTALLRYRIVDLQRMYAALPVSRVASHLSLTPEFTAQTLTEMIQASQLNASLTPTGPNAGDAVLRFHHTEEPNARTLSPDDDLQARTARIQTIVTYVRDADRRLQLTKDWVEHAKKQKKFGADVDPGDQMDLSFDAPGFPIIGEEGDEDIMGS